MEVGKQTAIVPDSITMLKARTRLSVTRLFKNYLILLEELATEHDDAMGKLEDNLPPQFKQYVDLADYWSDSKMENMRRKVLGAGNDVIREIEEQIDQVKTKE
jgi:hypothetical protein